MRETSSISNNQLENLIDLLPVIKKLIPLDCMLGLTDHEKFLAYLPGQDLKLTNQVGHPIPRGSAVDQALRSGGKITTVVPQEIYGTSFKAIAIPLHDSQGATIGVINLGISLKNQETLIAAAQSLAASTQQVSATIQELTASADQLNREQESLAHLSEGILNEVHKTDQILRFIREVAANSNLLGLNAAIEAARAGEHGRGFSVVAEEIRKMSNNSAKSVQDIKEILLGIQDQVEQINTKIADNSSITQQQAAATQELAATMQELAMISNKLEKLAEII